MRTASHATIMAAAPARCTPGRRADRPKDSLLALTEARQGGQNGIVVAQGRRGVPVLADLFAAVAAVPLLAAPILAAAPLASAAAFGKLLPMCGRSKLRVWEGAGAAPGVGVTRPPGGAPLPLCRSALISAVSLSVWACRSPSSVPGNSASLSETASTLASIR